jgi:hypothetical protein
MAIRWHAHPQRKGLEPVGTYEPGAAEFTFQAGDVPEAVRLNRYRVWDVYRRIMLRRALLEDGAYSLSMAVPKGRSTRSTASAAQRRAEQRINRAMRDAMRHAQPVDFLFSSERVRRAAAEARIDADAPKLPFSIEDDRVRLYCQATDFVEWRLQNLFENLYYLGPLRAPPRRVYELSGEMPADVGTRGEHAPEIVHRWRGDPSRLKELATWLRRFGVDREISSVALGTGGFSLRFGGEDAVDSTSVRDTGFGVSQVLPLIVQGIQSEAGSRIISEQPEIHLNPRLESVLADLFVSFVNRGVGVIAETHSEHLLLRLRRLIADGMISSDDVALYFVEQADDESRMRQVPVETSGMIRRSAWPRGFFEDSLREAMALAQAQAKRSVALSPNADDNAG